MEWKKTESAVQPDAIDETSSKTTVYLRKDIEKKEQVVEGKTFKYYEYKELKIPKDEYAKEKVNIEIKQQRADIDYLALMLGIHL